MNTWGWVNSFGIFQAYYTQLLSLPSSEISWIGSVSVFLLFFAGALTGRLVDAGYFRWVFGVGIILQISGVMFTSICTHYWHFFAAQGVVVGLGHSCVFCPVLAVLSTYFAKRRALAMGVAACGSAVGGIIFPSLVRVLLLKVGFARTLRITGFVQLVTLTVALILAKPRIRPRQMAFTIASFATLTGPPIAGAIIDHKDGYKGAQAFAVTAMALGAGFLIAAKKRRMKRTGTGWMVKI